MGSHPKRQNGTQWRGPNLHAAPVPDRRGPCDSLVCTRTQTSVGVPVTSATKMRRISSQATPTRDMMNSNFADSILHMVATRCFVDSYMKCTKCTIVTQNPVWCAFCDDVHAQHQD